MPVFRTTSVSANTEVATMRASGGGLQQQTTGNRFDSLSPTFSPDGRQIAFESNRDGNWEIYLAPWIDDIVPGTATPAVRQALSAPAVS